MADAQYRVKVGNSEYLVTAPDANTAWQWANMTHAQPAAPAPVAAPEPEEKLGFFGALKSGATVLGDVPEALGFAGFASDAEGARKKLVEAQETEGVRATGFGMDKTFGENVQTAKEMAGESLGFLAAPAAAGFTATAASAPFLGPAAPVAGTVAALSTVLAQYQVLNLTRQAQEDESRIAQGEAPLGAMPGRATAAAVGQTGLDAASLFIPFLRPVAAAFPFLRPLVGAGSKKAAGEVTEAIVEASLKKQLTIKGGIARGTAQGVAFEIPQEVAQTVLERWQAKLDLTGADAEEEYKQAAIGAAILGGGFGGVVGGVSAARAKSKAPPPPGEEQAQEEEAPPPSALIQEFDRLFTAEVLAEMQNEPGITKAEAIKRVQPRAMSIAERAKAAAEETEQVDADLTTEPPAGGGVSEPAVDVTGGVGAGVPPTGPAAVSGAGVPSAGVADTTGLVPPAPDVLPPVVGAGVQPSPLEITGKQVTNTIPTIEAAFTGAAQMFGETYGVTKLNQTQKKLAARAILESPGTDPVDAIEAVIERGLQLRGETVPSRATAAPVVAPTPTPAPTLTQPIYDAPDMSTRMAAAKPVATSIMESILGDAKAPKQTTDAVVRQAATKMTMAAAQNETFDPTEIVRGLMVEKGLAPAPMVAPTPTPAVEATPAVGSAVIRPDDVFRGEGPPKITVESTDKPFVVRGTDQKQIDDMVASGLVRPKPGGYGKQKSAQIYFGESNTAVPTGVFARPKEGEFTLVGKSESLVGKEGPIPIDQLDHIWENRNGELTDVLPDILKRNQEFAPAAPVVEAAPAPVVEPAPAPVVEPAPAPAPAPAVEEATAEEPLTYEDVLREAESYLADDGVSGLLKPQQYQQLSVLAEQGNRTPEELQDLLRKVVPAEKVTERAYAAPAEEAAPVEEAAPAEAVEEEAFDEEIDYDAHPLMQEHETKYDDAIAEISSAENMKELRKLVTRFKREGLLDADDVIEINERIADVANNERLDEGMSALEEALDNQRDNQREDVEERIREALEATPAAEQTFEDIGEPITETPTTVDLTNEPRNTDIDALAETLPDAQRVYVRAALDKIMARYARNNNVEQLLGALEELRQNVEARIDRQREQRSRDRVRGFERAMEVLYRAERTGALTPQAASLVRWLLSRNPRIADDLAISLPQGGAQSPAGQYNPATRIATIFTSRANDGTAAHEVLHHAERLMPENVRAGIRAAWRRRIDDLMALAERTNNADMRRVLGTIVQAYYGSESAQQALRESFEAGTIPRSVYHLSNPSEFWAVNATDLVGVRAARTGWLGAARTWLGDFIETAKDLFGLPNDSAVIAGLKAVLAAKSGMVRGSMLAERTGTFLAPAAGGGKKPKTPKPFQLTANQLQSARRAAGLQQAKISKIQKRIVDTKNSAELLSKSIELAKLVRGDKENLALLKGSIETYSTKAWRTVLPLLDVRDIFRIIAGRIPTLEAADKLYREDITKFETKEFLGLAKELETISKFLKRFPKAAQVISDIQFMAVAYQVDPSKAVSAQAYAANVDKVLATLRQEQATETDPKKLAGIASHIKNRTKAIEDVYNGFSDTDGRVFGYKDLNKAEYGAGEGKRIFALMRDGHRRDLEANYDAVKDRIETTSSPATKQAKLAKFEAAFKTAKDQVIYFPLMREGKFYARIGKGENSIFSMFTSETEMNRYVRVMQARGETVSEYGSVADLRNQFQKSADSPIKDVLDILETAKASDIDAIKDQVFDIWLQTMSNGDMRKHMAPRKLRAGYSTNIIKNYADFRRSSITNLKRAKYGQTMKLLLLDAKKSVAGVPDQGKMNAFIDEIQLHLEAALAPSISQDTVAGAVWETLIRYGNKAAYYHYLANTKTALIQLTSMHVTSFPILAQRYGHVKAGLALAKYGFSSLAHFAASPLLAVKRPNGRFTYEWTQPTLKDNVAVTRMRASDPDLYNAMSEGWQEGQDVDLFLDTFTQSLTQVSGADPDQRTVPQELARGRVDIASMRGIAFAFSTMGTLMHQMERVNREATYMAALELAYRERRKQKKPHVQAKKEAAEEATELAKEATFDFSNYNKPRVLTTGLGRVGGQFYTFPYMFTSLLVRKMFTTIKVAKLPIKERVAALEIAVGTMANLVLWGGLTAIPFFGLAKVMGIMYAAIFDDDDEEGGLSYIDEDGNIKATYDFDWWFRNVFIKKFFGPEGTVPNLMGLTPEQAKVLELMAEKGVISTLTDIDFANSLALDFFFFLPEQPRAETAEGKVVETVFNIATGAAGGMALDYIKMGADLSEGYTQRALERLPKLISAPLKAARFSEEGQRTYQYDMVGMPPEFWTDTKLILQALNFSSTEADRKIKQNYAAQTIKADVRAARTAALLSYKKAVGAMEVYGSNLKTQQGFAAALETIAKYNETYPTDPIGIESQAEAEANTIKSIRESEATKGVPYEEGKTPYLSDILLQSMRE